jgi:hypothetical protein
MQRGHKLEWSLSRVARSGTLVDWTRNIQAFDSKSEVWRLWLIFVTWQITIYGKWKAGHKDLKEVNGRIKCNSDDGVVKSSISQVNTWSIYFWTKLSLGKFSSSFLLTRIPKWTRDRNKSAAIFMNPPMVRAFGKQRKRMRTKIGQQNSWPIVQWLRFGYVGQARALMYI